MSSINRSGMVRPFLYLAGLGLMAPGSAHAFPDHHRKATAYAYAPVPMGFPVYGAAPMMPMASAPVFVGAISTASAPTYAAPAASAPTYVTPVASAPTYAAPVASAPTPLVFNPVAAAPAASAPASNATTASAPTSTSNGQWLVWSPGTTAAAPGVAAAPTNTTLPKADVDAIREELTELKESLKEDGVTGSERRNQLLDKAKELIAEARDTSVDDLKAADKSLARRLVKETLDGSTGDDNGGNPGTGDGGVTAPKALAPGQTSYVIYQQAAAPAYPQYTLYPMAPVSFVPVKPCGHKFFCLCKSYP
ncbi:hypothetical protein [Aquisphaera insulae]|uniref:hypothetical protein n=1 Tax=Aquisphaera insulae TaxID=2712864 RepID=UPI0013EADF45|nr:hypothetical protein [Aquisphaera insulae]